MNAMRYEKNIVQLLTRNLQLAYMSLETQDAGHSSKKRLNIVSLREATRAY